MHDLLKTIYLYTAFEKEEDFMKKIILSALFLSMLTLPVLADTTSTDATQPAPQNIGEYGAPDAQRYGQQGSFQRDENQYFGNQNGDHQRPPQKRDFNGNQTYGQNGQRPGQCPPPKRDCNQSFGNQNNNHQGPPPKRDFNGSQTYGQNSQRYGQCPPPPPKSTSSTVEKLQQLFTGSGS